jgi:hypothetical protein
LFITNLGRKGVSTRASREACRPKRPLNWFTAFDEYNIQRMRRTLKMRKNIHVVAVILMIVALGFVSLRAVAADEQMTRMEQMITQAKTPADHGALAAFYDKEAQEARQKQAEHLKMKEWYEKHPAMNKTGFSFHCQQIALQFQKMAEEYEALAKMHRDMAKAAK